MKRLSVCMIVKNEEALLSRCLDSVQGIADEIVIVDTGSTDRTKEIAARYTSLIFDYTWSNDFAAARNESLQHATGKWILVMDADEYLAVEDYDQWNDFLDKEESISHLAYTLPIINFTGDKEYQDDMTTSPVTRLFPNGKGIRFERPIHEQLTRGELGELYHKKIDLNIYHTGYQDQRVAEKDKHTRNMQIFEQMKKNQQLSEYDWFTLGNQYRYAKEEQQALECYERALQGADPKLAWYSHCLVGLITLYYKTDQIARSWQLTEQQLIKFSEYPEYHTIKGIHLETLGFFDEAASCYTEAIELAEKRAKGNKEFWLIDPAYSFESPVQQLISMSFRLNNNQQAIYWLSRLLNKNNKNPRVLLQLVEWLSQNEKESAIIEFLNKTYDKHNKADSLLLFKVAAALGQAEIAGYYHQYLHTQNEISDLDRLQFAMLQNDQKSWKKLLAQHAIEVTEDNKQHLWSYAAAGSFIWNEFETFFDFMNKLQDPELAELASMIMIIAKNEAPDQGLAEQHADSWFVLAKQLFLLRQFEWFDRLVNIVRTPQLVNHLANYFYNLGLTEMAMNYYSILLSQGALNGVSLENLGMYHLNHGYHEDAVGFLDHALQDEPGKRYLYTLLIRSAEGKDKLTYIERFKSQFPEFMSISFVKRFVEEQYVSAK
ncbi:glycosyltransferase [Paenibacillus medicaginis]|uniref:Glycosyltransferase n=1 Tax=Paenibacillus medicaginis TaxID=1470560 RepID=A0ABV5BX87_9BACL